MPNLVLLLFMLALAGFVWLLHKNEQDERQDSLIEDILWQEQTLRLDLSSQQTQLSDLARALANQDLSENDFSVKSQFLLSTNQEITGMVRLTADNQPEWHVPTLAIDTLNRLMIQPQAQDALHNMQLTGRPTYSETFPTATGDRIFILFVPILQGRTYKGALATAYSLKTMLQVHVPWWIARKHQISVVDLDGHTLASKFDQLQARSDVTHDLSFDPPGHGLLLRATSYQTSSPILPRVLIGVLVALAVVMVWTMWALGRHMRERLAAERALREETAMRRAMEDSIVSGIRATDLEGRITHVNRAFCEMTGFSEEELLGCSMPMPYWAPEQAEECAAMYRAVLAGQVPSSGYSMRFMRKNGERFDVRVYASPLIDGQGRHTGWMGSLYDITELKREREALKASHERFVTVLNGLDAAVTVISVDTRELLFSNLRFRTWFGLNDINRPFCIIPLLPLHPEEPQVDGEVWDAQNRRWYHVQRRQSVWVDGHPVWLAITNDITDRKLAVEREQQQAERLQHTSRLISMGEMASSLAHELNQPLAAISSYSTGCRNLLANQAPPDWAPIRQALDKISAQAQRAGSIIRSIREFVQRREPKLATVRLDELIDNVLALLDSELRKRPVALRQQRAALPPIQADRVMLEQVLVNLIKNALEAMAEVPANVRSLTLQTRRDGEEIIISVADRGPGLSEEEKSQLFVPFYTTKGEGMGMGLNICRGIIEYHHGRLWVEDNPGGGCRFLFSLPCATAKEPSTI